MMQKNTLYQMQALFFFTQKSDLNDSVDRGCGNTVADMQG